MAELAMTPTPPSSTASPSMGPGTTAGPNNENYRVIRKRNRVPLSCAPCRNRKLKCNRSSPCENCVKRGDATSCSYASPGNRRKTNTRTSPSTAPDDMQNRIDRLEGLVLSLVTNGNENAEPAAPDRTLSMSMSSQSQDYSPSQAGESFAQEEEEGESETDRVAKSFGVMHVNNNKALYMGEAHWAAILSDINEVKNYWTEHKKLYEDQAKKVQATREQSGRTTSAAPVFLIGGSKNQPQYSELIASLPGRDAVDKMVARYFNDYDPSTHILHPPAWRRAYESHWRNSAETDPAFLGQIFAICGLAMQSYHRAEDEPYEYRGRTQSLGANYRMLTQQCLLLADYVRPTNVILETLILQLHGEYTKSGEGDVGVWILGGMIVRLAMRMGLHRDSKHYSAITPFQGEMRRRIWTFVRQVDALLSFQIGLPSMIRAQDCDTELPSNIFDEDFDEDSQALPPSRPVTEWTQVSYLISKAALAYTFGKIVEATQSIVAAPYEDIMQLDAELRETYHGLPSILHTKAADSNNLEPVNTLMMRFSISSLYNKGICVLHRKYLGRARENGRYAQSRRACVDASMAMLRAQVTLHQESQPGRRMQNLKWYSSSIIIFDFLLAATLVCLDLFYTAQEESAGRQSGDIDMWGTCRRDEMIKAIEMSCKIWDELKDQYMEAFKAMTMLNIMLKKVQTIRAQTAVRMAQRTYQYSGDSKPAQQYSPPEDEKPEHSAAITLGMLSSGGMTPGTSTTYNSSGPYPPTPNSNNAAMGDSGLTPNFSAEQLGMNAPSPLSFFTNNGGMDAPANLDWAAWDSYIQSTNVELGNEMWTAMDIPPTGQEPPDQPQQLDSNLFANGPGVFPPGTTL